MSGFLLNPYIVTSPPVNTVLPVISGTTQVGQTLTTTNGTWLGNPTSYAYQWNRSGSAISGATSSSYTLVLVDASNTITVTVTATSTAGSTAATSAATATVTVPAPVNTALPTISGNQVYGNTMTATTGSWDYSPTSYAYQWKRNGSNIGTNSSTYTTTVSDDNTTLTVTVTATNATGSTASTSSGLSIYRAIPVNSVTPTTNGNYAVGQTLSISSYGTWSNTPTDYYVQWYNSAGTYLGGGYTGTTYTIPAGQVGYQIRAAVYAINNNPSWGGPAYTTYTSTVYNATPVNTSVPTISGTTTSGSTLTASAGTWTNSPTSYTYQWYRNTGAYLGAGSTYVLSASDVGYTVRVLCTASNSIASGTAYSAYTATIAAAPSGLYSFTSFTFTNAGITGRTGPTLANCLSSYNTSTYPWLNNTSYFNVATQGIQLWTVPMTGNYTITAVGAFGGGTGAYGATCTGTFSLTQGQVIKILVGQQGGTGSSGCGASMGGGGGGTFVTNNSNTALIVAGGGGGRSADTRNTNYYASYASTSGVAGQDTGGTGGGGGSGGGAATGQCVNSGCGGGGLSSNGSYSIAAQSNAVGVAFVNGGTGGTGYYDYGGTVADGGFGGGAGTNSYMGGGGGGYSGGGGGGVGSCSCTYLGGGGGGGSYNGGTSQSNSQNTSSANGYVTITKI